MQRLAARPQQMPQDHAKDNLLRDHIDPNNTTPPFSSIESMQPSGSSPTDAYHPDDGGDGPDGRKAYGKRELSTSKRAAQNRAAQRAFRQRKEGYIKKLEEQVKDYTNLSETFKSLQQENYQLRDYIISLQSRLLESQGEVPPPPSNLNGLEPEHAKKARQPHQTLPQPTHMSQHQVGQATLPRLSELGAMSPQQNMTGPSPMLPQQKDMTAAQAQLQGSSILQNPPGR